MVSVSPQCHTQLRKGTCTGDSVDRSYSVSEPERGKLSNNQSLQKSKEVNREESIYNYTYFYSFRVVINQNVWNMTVKSSRPRDRKPEGSYSLKKKISARDHKLTIGWSQAHLSDLQTKTGNRCSYYISSFNALW